MRESRTYGSERGGYRKVPVYSISGVCCANPSAWVFADVVLLVLYFREMKHICSMKTGLQPEASSAKMHRKLSSAHAYR